jgi:chromosome segregation ATPase
LGSLFIKLKRSAAGTAASNENEEIVTLRNLYRQLTQEFSQLQEKYDDVEKQRETAEAGYLQFEDLYSHYKQKFEDVEKREKEILREREELRVSLETTESVLNAAQDEIERMKVRFHIRLAG